MTFAISGGYYNEMMLNDGLPIGETVINFPNWNVTSGDYTTRCSTYVADDQRRLNDALGGSWVVGYIDVVVLRILSPVGSIETSRTITPR